jgi:cellulose synthase/poly-beta-1,6-N-acetylglucosamine synthase-like glycosyltransferase
MALFILIFFLLMIMYGWTVEQYRRGWINIPEFTTDHSTPSTFISLVIPARNEQHNIARLIDSLVQLQYPNALWEVIIVDDHSTDETLPLLLKQKHKLPNLQVMSIGGKQPVTGHKKAALATGVDASNGTLIVTTDADCTFEPKWLNTLASFYEKNSPVMIAAPVRLEGKKSFLSYFQQLDFTTLQGITGSAVEQKLHVLCNGANLAYEKKVFNDVGGFEGISHIASGDDMLLMQKFKALHPDQVRYLKSRDAIVTTGTALSWKAFFNQRIRWASKSTHYQDKKLFRILLLVFAVNLCFVIQFVLAWWMNLGFFFLFVFLLAKMIIEFPLLQSVARFFNQTSTLKFFPVFQPVHILYTIIAGFLGKFGKFEWKGRLLKQ